MADHVFDMLCLRPLIPFTHTYIHTWSSIDLSLIKDMQTQTSKSPPGACESSQDYWRLHLVFYCFLTSKIHLKNKSNTKMGKNLSALTLRESGTKLCSSFAFCPHFIL